MTMAATVKHRQQRILNLKTDRHSYMMKVNPSFVSIPISSQNLATKEHDSCKNVKVDGLKLLSVSQCSMKKISKESDNSLTYTKENNKQYNVYHYASFLTLTAV